MQCPIETVYENGNAGSHFHPVRDSARVYRALFGPVLKYAAASLAGTAVDLGAFFLLSTFVFRGESRPEVLAATALARLVSASANYLLNRHFVFRQGASYSVWRYAVLAVCTLLLSSEGVTTLLKAVVDVLLFVVNYQLCRKWVFKAKARK